MDDKGVVQGRERYCNATQGIQLPAKRPLDNRLTEKDPGTRYERARGMAELGGSTMTTVTALNAAIGQRVRLLREQLRLSQGKFALILYRQGFRTTQGTIHGIETGTRPIRLAEALALCHALERDLTVLLDGTGIEVRPSMAAAIRVLQDYDRADRVP